MAFDNETFPFVPMKHDRRMTVIDPVSVNTNGNYEYRVKRQQWERFTFEIPAQTMTNEQKENVRQFLMARRNGLNTFLYEDPEYSQLVDVKLGHDTGSQWYLYLPFGANTAGDTHPLFNQVVGDFTVEVDSSPGTISSYQLSNGIPTFTISGTTGTEDVRLTGTAKFVVRLNGSFADALYALDCNNAALGHQVNSIPLAEVHGE